MKVLVTGPTGFIAKNLLVRLGELEGYEVVTFSHQMPLLDLSKLVLGIDAVVHLAGVNRPLSQEEYQTGNADFTQNLCQALIDAGLKVPVIFASSSQAELDNPYGKSKQAAENILRQYAMQTGALVYIYRLPNVFGKWCRPNYNSVVATFCYNIARRLPITINNAESLLWLVYIDDVVDEFIQVLGTNPVVSTGEFSYVSTQYQLTLGKLAQQLTAFLDSRDSLISENVGSGLVRALYATFMSYLPVEAFAYEIPKHADPRGGFVEMLKTKESGQFSYFTAYPGITRGGHYHHTKTEKFLVIKGKARFGFRHILTNESYELFTTGDLPTIVETIPGWSHDITNVGDEEMLVMLWANEMFDRDRPDTIANKV